MKQFLTIAALTATTAYAGRCKLECPSPLTVNDDCTICICPLTACDGDQVVDSHACECIDPPPPCDDKECRDRYTLNEDTCECDPAAGEDRCDEYFEGKFNQENGDECPAPGEGDGEEGSGALAQLATMSFAFTATLLF